MEAVNKRKRGKQAKFLVGAFCLAEAVKNGDLEELKARAAQSLTREANQRGVTAFGMDGAGDENGEGSKWRMRE